MVAVLLCNDGLVAVDHFEVFARQEQMAGNLAESRFDLRSTNHVPALELVCEGVTERRSGLVRTVRRIRTRQTKLPSA